MIAGERKKQIRRKLTFECALLWWSDVLIDGLLAFVRHCFGVFSSGAGEKM
jgi:hypothetical protein